MYDRTFVFSKQAERIILDVKTNAADTCLKKKIQFDPLSLKLTAVHTPVHPFLTFSAIRVMKNDFGRRKVDFANNFYADNPYGYQTDLHAI